MILGGTMRHFEVFFALSKRRSPVVAGPCLREIVNGQES